MRPRWLPHLPSRIASLMMLIGPLALLLATVAVHAKQDRGRDTDDQQAGSDAHDHGNDDSALIGISKIKHIIIIMQENRSFDTYFGTYPGADGIPMSNGRPTLCIPSGTSAPCTRPFVDHADVNGGGPHSQGNAVGDINGGKMNGFVV